MLKRSLQELFWSTLQSSVHQNDQTQKQFLPPSNPSHEHLTWNTQHYYTIMYSPHTWNTQHYYTIMYSPHTWNTQHYYTIIYSPHTYFFFHFKFARQTSHITVCIVYCVFSILYICILFFCWRCPVLLLSFCCTVELLSLQQIPRMCKHTWPIKLILILILKILTLWAQFGHFHLGV